MQRPTCVAIALVLSAQLFCGCGGSGGFENVELLKVDLSGAIDPQGRPLR